MFQKLSEIKEKVKNKKSNVTANAWRCTHTHTHTHTHRCILTKRKGIIAGILIVILAIAGILAIFQKDERISKKRPSISSPELARAMTYTQVADGDEATNSQYVKFDAFFLRDLDGDGYAESIRGTCKEIGSQDTLYIELGINDNGTFKNGKITINSDNFYLETAIPMDVQVKSNAIGINTKEIFLNDVGVGTQKMLSGTVKSGDYRYNSTKAQAIGTDTSKYSKINSITLTGTHVAEDGTETPVEKTVNFNIDWYGTTGAELPRRLGYYSYDYKNQSRDIENIVDEENNEVNLEFEVLTKETKNVLNISRAEIETEIPQINGYDPIRVEVTGKNVTYEYDESSRKLLAQKDAVIDENGKVIENAYTDVYNDTTNNEKYNKFNLKITYPIEAYKEMGSDTIEIKLPVSGCYYGFNNTNSEFTNPYKSNVAKDTIIVSFRRLEGESSRFDTYVGKCVYDPSYRYIVSKNKPLRIYNELSEKETNDTYTVRWYGSTGSSEYSKMIMKETSSDVFIKTDSSEESMENLTKYVGIYFSNPAGMLEDEGEIKVYDDETGDLLVTFNKDNWNRYSESNPYKYSVPVKRVRVETTAVSENSSLYVYNIKELDDEYITNNYTREEFDNFNYIKTSLSGYMGESETPSTDTHRANYEAPISVANVSVEQTAMSTQNTEEHYKIKIDTKTNTNYNQEKWSNGSFLLKLPEEIIDIELNEVTVNNSNITITSYETYEENGSRFIKILTENENPDSYQIVIDSNITPDPRISTVTRAIELYATNENCENYYYNSNDIYDVNNNSNTTEKVNKTSVNINFTSPNSLLTNQIGTNYDGKGSIAVAPQVALVDKDQRKATVEIEVKNNYANTISEIQLLGKVPSEGNTYAISGANLSSTFTSSMTSAGIQVPEALREYATIYYSEKENTTKDINDANNNWTQNPEDWTKVKSYLIVLNNYVMPKDTIHKFTYEIEIPTGLNYNQVSYSHYGVYFSLDTDEGKYRTSVEPNRLGFMIAKEFNIQVTKYQKDSNKVVSGATYSLTEDEVEDGRTRTTNNNGKFAIDKVLAEKTYILKEVKSPKQYELNNNEIKFTTKVNDRGELEPELISGTLRNGSNLVVNNTENGYVLEIQVEDEVRPNIKITKTETGTATTLQGIKFKLTGKGYERGRILTTNNNGEVSLVGLYVNEEYTLEETKAEGYYLASPIKFKIVNNEGNYTVETIEGTVPTNTVETVEEIPTINFKYENDKIPTYELEISKIKKLTKIETSNVEGEKGNNTEEITYLSGAKFKLYKENKEIGEYISDENGKITISNLYQYEEDRNLDQTYVLKEVLAPDGYSKVKDITFKVQKIDGSLKFVEDVQEGQTEKTYTVEGNTVKVTVEDSPSFRLIKKDAETEKLLSRIKFAIYNIDDGQIPAVNSKGEILGTKENINGKEYYTLTTDTNGVITADLKEGLYKAVEVEAPEKYDISKSTYYFGIGVSREGKKVGKTEWGKAIGGSRNDEITSVAETADGGCIVGGNFYSSSIDLGNGVILNNNGNQDGMLIKYSADGEVEWGKAIGGSYDDRIKSVTETADGGCIVGGYFYSSSIDLGKVVILNNNGSNDGMLIKYGSNGEVEWGKAIGGSSNDYIKSVTSTSDGGYIVGGYFNSDTIDLGNGVILNNNGRSGYSDGMLIKYSADGEVEWGKAIGGISNDYINSVAETSDGGYIAGGQFSSTTIDLGKGVMLNNNAYSDGMLIKYSAGGEVEWGKAIGGSDTDEITSVAETSDGGCIVGGYFYSSSIDLGKVVILNKNGYSDGMVIKYGSNGEVEWGKAIGGSGTDEINSVAETRDGGYIAGGYFRSRSIDLGKGVILNNNGISKGMLIKYSADGEVEWGKAIGGSNNDKITSIAETADGGCIVGGYFNSDTIDLGNGVILNNNGSDDGMLIKIKEEEIPEVVTKQGKAIGGSGDDRITSIVNTSDGGYIVGGYFYNASIDLGNGIILNRSSGDDGMLIKYSADGEVEWAKGIGGNTTDGITSVVETEDGGYIVGGYFTSKSINLGNGVILNNNGSYDGMLIKYSVDGEVEWGKAIGGYYEDRINSVAETVDGGYIVGGYFKSYTIDLGNGVILNNNNDSSEDGMLIKYGSNGEVEWGKAIGGSNNDKITSIAETADGGYIVGGYFYSDTIDLENGVILNKNGYSDGMVIKYGSNGEVEWGKAIGGSSDDSIDSVTETADGGYIVGGKFYSTTIDLGNRVILNNSSSISNSEGMIIKYRSDGEIGWAKVIGGIYSDQINSVVATPDGGYIVGGSFGSPDVDLGNGIILNSNGSSDGMVIKYGSNGEVEWGKAIGGSSDDSIDSVTETADGGYIAGGEFYSSSIKLENGIVLNNNGSYDGIIIKVNLEMGVPDVQEITALNNRKEFKITTEVRKIDGIAGGIITGGTETVKYGDNSTKEIKMVPDENYEIISITINGKEYPYEKNEDGTYTMPLFENVQEDKHVVVTYALKDNKITINKVDSKTKEILSGVKFKLDQIEERNEPVVSDIVKDLTDNGQGYTTVSTTNEVTGALGGIVNGGDYYFVEEDGKYVPTNSKTYQVANGGTAGISGTTANSYMPIDLTGKTGQFAVIVNASTSSENKYDFGYATVTESTNIPAYNNETGRFIYTSGTTDTSAKDYTSMTLEGGKVYYLHLGYRKDSSGDKGDDRIVFNSIKVYEETSSTVTYNFENQEGKYVSSNQGQDNTVANSYIPIDLSSYTGKYNLVVNAEVSSQSSDYGYATVTEGTDRPAYNNSTGRFIYISQTQSAKDYETVLQGGKMYYLHLGYYKNATTSSGTDTFTVNSVNVTLNDSELYHTEIETNSAGQAIMQIPFGKYQVTEVNTPEGYEKLEKPVIIEFRADKKNVLKNENTVNVTLTENNEFLIENRKLAKVHVHHYLKDRNGNLTTTKLAEDEVITDKVGEKYITTPRLDLGKYELEKDSEGNAIIPTNSVGTYTEEEQEVIYYYVERQIPLTVHHYIEGTNVSVPLANGEIAKDETDIGYEGDTYTTEAISEEQLSEEYELVGIPSNSEGIYEGNEVVVTYYYKKVERMLTLTKYRQDGITPLQGAKFEIKPQEEVEKPQPQVSEMTDNGKIGFIKQEEKYVSNNKTNSSGSYSYIKVDLTGVENTIVKINAEVSSEKNYDIGYVTITETPDVPTYNKNNTYFIKMSGTQEATEYETELEGGKVHYIHFAYEKDSSSSSGTDTFTINSIQITSNEKPKDYTYVTNSQGKIQLMLEAGEYEITEIEAPEGYVLPKYPTTNIIITKDITEKTLEITNDKQKGTVIVHHYIEGTTTPVPLSNGTEAQDEIKTGYIGDTYASKAREDIAEGYKVVAEPELSSGKYTNETIEITYYYRSVLAKIIENTVEKTGTELITKEDDKVTYDISYKAEIADYNGDGTLTIVDELPFTIDESNSTLNDGTYDETSKTITWTIPLENIDTYKDGNKTIEVNKQIAVTYKNMDYSKKTFTNKVTSKLLLGEKEYPAEATTDTQTNFTKTVEVTKKWNHTNNIYELPNAVKVQLKRGSTVIAEKDMTSINRVTDTEIPENEDIWKIEFTDLEKYDDKGQEIDYTVNEVEINEGDLKYYQASYDQESKTITNTYVGPVISQTKEAITENGKAYVVEGEKITYKITAKNDGKMAKNVVIKDNIPSGTTYVENSIKIDELVRANTKEELSNGITVNVPANGEVKLSFDVTVNKLDEGTYFKQLKNTATVDGKNTNETTINVNKSNIVFEKTVTPEGNVQSGQEITYNIKVRNTGSLADKVKIEDNIPANTTYVKDSIKLRNTEYKDEELNVITTAEDALNAERSETAVGEAITKDEVEGTATKDEKSETTVEETTTKDEELQSEVEETTAKNKESQTKAEKITLTKDEDKITKISVENLQIDSNTEIILSFKVTVNDNIINGAKIINTAVINEKTTNTTENTVIKPVINVQKEITNIEHTSGQENRLDYVFKGDKITYNITATNEGDLGGYITVKDIISENTTLETGSIKINGVSNYTLDRETIDLTGKTDIDLANGIRVYVPERQNGKAGETVISFTVQVKATAEGDIENKATWIEGEKTEKHETETVKVPVVVFEKTATIKRIADTETNLPENTVTANDEIKYTITVKNTGTAETKNFTITDTVPENTTINSSSITNDGILKDNKITWNIAGLQAGETKSVGFTVTVKYNKEKTAKIKNTAHINEVPTNETTTNYQKPTPKLETNITKNGDKTAIAGNSINYEISYTGEIKDFVGKANIVIIDQLPYEIDEVKSNLNDGIYNKETKTITWTIPVENIDTYTSGNLNKEITKNIELHYKTEAKAQTIENTVTATTQLIELPEEIVKAQEKTASHTVTIKEIQELPATGGKGIIIFIESGMLLITISIIMLIRNFKDKKFKIQ